MAYASTRDGRATLSDDRLDEVSVFLSTLHGDFKGKEVYP
jgi:hypothetical protein